MFMRDILVGAVCLLIVAILSPHEFYPWVIDTAMGIVISALFLTPLASYVTKRGEKYLAISLPAGFLLYLVYIDYADLSFLDGVLYVFRWMATTTLVAAAFGLLFTEYRNWVLSYFRKG